MTMNRARIPFVCELKAERTLLYFGWLQKGVVVSQVCLLQDVVAREVSIQGTTVRHRQDEKRRCKRKERKESRTAKSIRRTVPE